MHLFRRNRGYPNLSAKRYSRESSSNSAIYACRITQASLSPSSGFAQIIWNAKRFTDTAISTRTPRQVENVTVACVSPSPKRAIGPPQRHTVSYPSHAPFTGLRFRLWRQGRYGTSRDRRYESTPWGHSFSASVGRMVRNPSVHFARCRARAVPHLGPLSSSRMPHVSEVYDCRGSAGSNGRSSKQHGARSRLWLRNGGMGRRMTCSKCLACPLGKGILGLGRKRRDVLRQTGPP